MHMYSRTAILSTALHVCTHIAILTMDSHSVIISGALTGCDEHTASRFTGHSAGEELPSLGLMSWSVEWDRGGSLSGRSLEQGLLLHGGGSAGSLPSGLMELWPICPDKSGSTSKFKDAGNILRCTIPPESSFAFS